MKYVKVVKDSSRPFRLWDSKKKHQLSGRNFSDPRRALNCALILVRWGEVGSTLEVFDIRTARHLGTYKRALNGVYYDRQTNGGSNAK